jgi:hypothetical protein
MYFRGFHQVRDQWDEDAWEDRCAEVFSSVIDETLEEGFEFASHFGPKGQKRIMRDLITEIRELERTYNFLKIREIASDDIEYVLTETDDYFSDRHANKCEWIDEPAKDFVTRYPTRKASARGAARCRALEDEWATLNFVIVF